MNLKERRIELGLSQRAAARAIGVTLVTYQNWEQEVGNPNEENQKKLDKVFAKKEKVK